LELREFLFEPLKDKTFSFKITAKEAGILSGVGKLKELAAQIGLEVLAVAEEGEELVPGKAVLKAKGNAEMVAQAEELLLGAIGKPSGVATAAAAIVKQAGQVKVVCGAWKKVSQAVKDELRQAALTGGAGQRISDKPFIYLDKNYIRMFGDVHTAVSRARSFDAERLIVAQIRGETQNIVEEARAAVGAGAGILMVDTGLRADLEAVKHVAEVEGWRENIQLAFAGGVVMEDLEKIVALKPEIIDVGRAILDAAMLDFSLDVENS